MKKLKIYLDTCCYGRKYDVPSNVTVAVEAAAIAGIIDVCRITNHCIVGSTVVTFEIGKIRQAEKRAEIMTYVDSTINKYVQVTEKELVRAQALQVEGLGKMDSHHLAVAEAAGVDVLLTTDVDFLRICAKKNLSLVKVINPLNFLPEVINEYNDYKKPC